MADPITQLTSSTRYGRPDFASLFDRVAKETKRGARVGVFYCGPRVGAVSVEKAMRRVNEKGEVQFVFRKERF